MPFFKRSTLHLACFFLFLLCGSSRADHSLQHTTSKQPIIDEIIIKGLWRTESNVIHRELLFSKNDILTTKALLESVQRLKNLKLFSKVIPLLKLKSNNHVILTIEVEEKWTIIPYFNFAVGGGTTHIVSGIYDINVFGKYVESGFQYDNWNGEHGGAFWIHQPRFLNKRLLFKFEIASNKYIRQLYTTDAISQGSFRYQRKRFTLALEKEITPVFHLGLRGDLLDDTIESTTAKTAMDKNTLSLLNSTNNDADKLVTYIIELGKLDLDLYLVKGYQSRLTYQHNATILNSNNKIRDLVWRNKFFWHLPYKGNLGVKLSLGRSESEKIQHLNYIGGFINIRGYRDGQFRDNAYWQFNTEYRIPSIRNQWVVLQHIFFIDAAGTASELNKLRIEKNSNISAGTGFRLISPKVYNFNGRLDIAIFGTGTNQNKISLGAQQFF